MYYDINSTLSYNALFNIVLGGRGIGKSYQWKIKAVRDFLKKGKQFGYIRRYKDELLKTADKYFNDIIKNQVFPDTKIEYDGGQWYINEELAGYTFALTKASDYKSSAFPDISNLIFEEFIIDKSHSSYLRNEPFLLFDLYDTIARMRDDVILFMLGNAISMANPYFIQWDLSLPKNKNAVVRDNILLQVVPTSAEFKRAKENTRFGQMSRALGYADYSVDNKFYLDDEAQIMKKGKNTRFYFTLVWRDKKYGVWFDYDTGMTIISYDYDPYNTMVFTPDKESINKSIQYVKQYERHPFFRRIKEALETGTLAYENEKIQHEIKSMLKIII